MLYQSHQLGKLRLIEMPAVFENSFPCQLYWLT